MSPSWKTTVVPAFLQWIEALAAGLPAPARTFGRFAWARGMLSATLGTRKVRLALSAPNSVVAAVWSDDLSAFAAARTQPPGQWNRVVTLTRCEGAPHDRYLDLVAAMQACGETTQAQLAWMQACRIQDEDDRDSDLFALLFPKLPKAACIDTARSAAALLERLFPLARSRSPIDQMILALELAENVVDAAHDVSGPRLRRLIDQVDKALATLSRSPETAIVDVVKLARISWANAQAFLPGPLDQ